jgi:hypothetical protein
MNQPSHDLKRLLLFVGLLAVLVSPAAAPAQQRYRFHGRIQWIEGSKMVLATDEGFSVTLDLSQADQSAYRGLVGGDGVTVVVVVRPPTRRDDDAIPLVMETLELDPR